MPGSFLLGLISSLLYTYNSLGSFEGRTDPTSCPGDNESASRVDSYATVPSLGFKFGLIGMLTAPLGCLKCSGILQSWLKRQGIAQISSLDHRAVSKGELKSLDTCVCKRESQVLMMVVVVMTWKCVKIRNSNTKWRTCLKESRVTSMVPSLPSFLVLRVT